MPDESIDYRELVREALREVVRRVMEQVARNGLPEGHHFLIGFKTRAEGVRLPATLLKRYPDEMDIILQHQFSNLVVGGGSFSVTLRFSGLRHRLTVPFGALTRFIDPRASFGLQFDEEGEKLPVPAPDGKDPAMAGARHPGSNRRSSPGSSRPARGELIPFDRPQKS